MVKIENNELIVTHKKLNSKEEIVFLKLNEKELVKGNKKICDTKDIVTFVYENSSPDFNEVYLVFFKNGKKRSKIIFLKGERKDKFVNVANNYVKAIKSGEEISETKENMNEFKKFDSRKLKTNPEKFMLIGKTIFYKNNGDRLYADEQNTNLVFINSKLEVLYMGLHGFKLDYETLSNNKFYEISIKEDEVEYKITDPIPVQEEKIEKFKRNFINSKEIIFTDNQTFKIEFETEQKIHKMTAIYRAIIYICAFATTILILLTAKFPNQFKLNILDIMKTFAIGFFIILLMFAINLLSIISKGKKEIKKLDK